MSKWNDFLLKNKEIKTETTSSISQVNLSDTKIKQRPTQFSLQKTFLDIQSKSLTNPAESVSTKEPFKFTTLDTIHREFLQTNYFDSSTSKINNDLFMHYLNNTQTSSRSHTTNNFNSYSTIYDQASNYENMQSLKNITIDCNNTKTNTGETISQNILYLICISSFLYFIFLILYLRFKLRTRFRERV
jgi:hypothetical protein